MEERAIEPCQSAVLVYETKMLSSPYAADALNFWYGGMFGYVGALLTAAVVIAALNRMRPRGGAPA